MQPFEKLPDNDKSDILEYFRRFEDREPDAEGIFACGHCLMVYDDFSGEKRTMDGDERSFCKVNRNKKSRRLRVGFLFFLILPLKTNSPEGLQGDRLR